MRYLVAVLAVLALMVAPAAAQTPVPNPTKAEFAPSTDHGALEGYDLAFYDAADVQIAILDIGKPAVDPDGLCRLNINVQPIKFGIYTAKVRARGGAGAYSPWSDPSNLWVREPGKPGKIVVKGSV